MATSMVVGVWGFNLNLTSLGAYVLAHGADIHVHLGALDFLYLICSDS